MKCYDSLEKALKDMSLSEHQVKTNSEWVYLACATVKMSKSNKEESKKNEDNSNGLFRKVANEISKNDLIGIDFLVREKSCLEDKKVYDKEIVSENGAYFGKDSAIKLSYQTYCYVNFRGYVIN